MNIKADELGWCIDLPCLNCHSYDCIGSVHTWVPNHKGNSEHGFSTEEEAVADAIKTQQIHTKFCGGSFGIGEENIMIRNGNE